MFKEIVVCLIIIVSIFALDNTTQSYTEKSVNETTAKLEELRKGLIEYQKSEEQENKLSEDIASIYNEWMDFHDKLAYYIEHDELEKVETDLVSLKGNIEVKEYEIAVSELDKSIFVLEHILDKYKFNLDNIF